MHPLRTVATGLVIVYLVVGLNGWDLLADPVGWLLVLLGLAALKDELPRHGAVTGAAVVSLAVAALTWVPDWSVGRAVREDESLGWLASLPALVFAYLLSTSLAARLPIPWEKRFTLLGWGFVLAAALPVLIYGGGWDWLVPPTGLLVFVLDVLLVVWLWSVSREPASVDPSEPRT